MLVERGPWCISFSVLLVCDVPVQIQFVIEYAQIYYVGHNQGCSTLFLCGKVFMMGSKWLVRRVQNEATYVAKMLHTKWKMWCLQQTTNDNKLIICLWYDFTHHSCIYLSIHVINLHFSQNCSEIPIKFQLEEIYILRVYIALYYLQRVCLGSCYDVVCMEYICDVWWAETIPFFNIKGFRVRHDHATRSQWLKIWYYGFSVTFESRFANSMNAWTTHWNKYTFELLSKNTKRYEIYV